ncbi:tRNA dihydrouridine synthase DusB [Egibacter rhizosphaerae]|uniref:tRNA dihydrouridine synthase DusB n=1 Tax=Egibacter rhizosphaerae TaxID=1670831 RepID=UPI001F0D959A|nr:tRNA dihydrouridine synthase DusB [Egibacter rhizosphaerae]
MTLSIGPLSVDPPVVLAPMAGVTDAPFRVLCAEHGGGLYVSEMLTARGLVEGGERSWAMARHHPAEAPRSLQLYGSDPPVMGEAVRRLVAAGAVDHIDLNFGCPVAKITRAGGGAALPFKRRLLTAMVRAAVTNAGTVPVTVKMRLGLDDDRLTYLESGRIAADEGVAAIALHARTAEQGYAGFADWSTIARLREAVGDHVPVLGNGDIWAAQDAIDLVEATGCDGVVVGRGCLGRPWLFADLQRAFAGQPPLGPPELGTVATTIRRHLSLALDWYGDEAGTLRQFRKHLRWHLQGYPVGADVHKSAGQVETAADVDALVERLDPGLRVVPEAVAAPRGKTGKAGRLVLPHGWCDDPDEEPAVREPERAVSGG